MLLSHEERVMFHSNYAFLNTINKVFAILVFLWWLTKASPCQHLANTHFLLWITLCFIHCVLLDHDTLPLINLFCPHFDRADVSQLWQIVVPTVRSRHVLYQALGSEELSLPSGFLSEMFRNSGRSQHVQTEAVIRFVQNWLDYSQPGITSMPAVSFSVSGGRTATSCYSPPVFSVLTLHTDDWHDASL